MKLVIKKSKGVVESPTIKTITLLSTAFANATPIYYLEANEIPLIKFSDTGASYFVKDVNTKLERVTSDLSLDLILSDLDVVSSGSVAGVSSVSGDLVSNVDPTNPTVNRGYKVYTALVTQTGTTAPVATVLQNTLGGTVTWTYGSPGFYSATSSSLFTLDKTALFLTTSNGNAITIGKAASVSSVTVITQSSVAAAFANDLLNGATVEIRVYP